MIVKSYYVPVFDPFTYTNYKGGDKINEKCILVTFSIQSIIFICVTFFLLFKNTRLWSNKAFVSTIVKSIEVILRKTTVFIQNQSPTPTTIQCIKSFGFIYVQNKMFFYKPNLETFGIRMTRTCL